MQLYLNALPRSFFVYWLAVYDHVLAAAKEAAAFERERISWSHALRAHLQPGADASCLVRTLRAGASREDERRGSEERQHSDPGSRRILLRHEVTLAQAVAVYAASLPGRTAGVTFHPRERGGGE